MTIKEQIQDLARIADGIEAIYLSPSTFKAADTTKVGDVRIVEAPWVVEKHLALISFPRGILRYNLLDIKG